MNKHQRQRKRQRARAHVSNANDHKRQALNESREIADKKTDNAPRDTKRYRDAFEKAMEDRGYIIDQRTGKYRRVHMRRPKPKPKKMPV